MFASNEEHFGGPKASWRRSPRAGRSVRLAALALAVAGLVALAPATARANLVMVHSAKSGTLAGDQLTLHGVGRRVTWATNKGRSGVVSIARLHRRLFLPATPWATGTLHIAGQRGGQELALRLRRPRYNRARQTVRYRVKRLSKRRPARASGFRPRRRFGAASLSMVGARLVGDNGGLDCRSTLETDVNYLWEASAEGKWPTDTWDPGIPFQATIGGDANSASWGSDGGLLRGCSVTGVWTIIPWPDDPTQPVPSATVTVTTTYPWSGTPSYTNTCTLTNPAFTCQAVTNDAGSASWSIESSGQ